jgi:hypothetical protein
MSKNIELDRIERNNLKSEINILSNCVGKKQENWDTTFNKAQVLLG